MTAKQNVHCLKLICCQRSLYPEQCVMRSDVTSAKWITQVILHRGPLCNAVGKWMTCLVIMLIWVSSLWELNATVRLWTLKPIIQRLQLWWWAGGGELQLHTWRGREVSVNRTRTEGSELLTVKKCITRHYRWKG